MDHFKIVVTAALATLATLALLLVAVWSVWPRTAEASAAVAVHEFSFKHGDMAHRCDRFAPAHIDLVEAVAIHMLELNDVQQNDLAAITASARRWQDVAQDTCRQLDVSSLDSGLAEAEKVLALSADALREMRPLLVQFHDGLNEAQHAKLVEVMRSHHGRRSGARGWHAGH